MDFIKHFYFLQNMDIVINFQRSIILARQIVEEYNRTGDITLLEHLEIVKQGIIELLEKMETFTNN
jgi:hypothetical protein